MPTTAELFWIYFGAFAFLILAVQETVKPRLTNWSFMLLLVSIVSHVSRLGLVLQGVPRENPRVLFGTTTLLMLTGPAMLRMTYQLLDLTFKNRWVFILQLLPAGIVFAGEVVVYVFFPDQLAAAVRGYYDGQVANAAAATILAVGLYAGIYTAVVLLSFARFAHAHGLPYGKITALGAIVPVINIIGTFAYLFRSFEALKLIALFHTLAALAAFLFQARYPGFFSELASAIQESKYKNTPIDHIDLEELRLKIDKLVAEEKIYTDADLRLKSLALRLSLSGHQLSRVLNEIFGKNFNEFINEYRIKEAAALLLNKDGSKIIDISYHVGFNSLSVFNAKFRKYTGYTPKEFRKRSTPLV